MQHQDELHQLILTLTPSEKRYFKTNASKGGDAKSNYMQLFEAMDAQKKYDEQKLKAKNKDKKFVKYLAAEKKQLREQLMKYMRAYHANRTIDTKIIELLQNEAFFRDKGLKGLREKTLTKAKELATKYERYYHLQEILERQTSFVQEFEEKVLTEPVLKLITELKQLSIDQDTMLELWIRNSEIFATYRAGLDTKDDSVKNRADMLIAEVERYRTRLGGSFRMSIKFNRAYSNYHNIFRNREESYEYTKQEYQLYQVHPHFKEEYAMDYKICLANLISRAHSAKKFDEFERYIEELKKLPAATFNEEGEVFQNVYFSEHLYYINKGDFEKAEALIPTIEEGLIKYVSKINKARVLSFQFNIMIMYFLMHRFKEAALWSDKILEDKGEIKQSINIVTRILLPIIHFELGHADLVDSFTRSAYRDLQKKKRLHSFERLIINYLKDMPLSTDQKEFRTKLEAFDKQLQEIFDAPNEIVTHGMEEMSLWVKSKLTDKKMHVLVKEDL